MLGLANPKETALPPRSWDLCVVHSVDSHACPLQKARGCRWVISWEGEKRFAEEEKILKSALFLRGIDAEL